jgi:hypothetical protein
MADRVGSINQPRESPATLLDGDSRVDENNSSTEAFVGIQIARSRGRDNRCHGGQDILLAENRQETGAV